MRVRLRPAYTPAELAALYPRPHDHTRWPDHLIRVNETITLARDLHPGPLASVADLSCGDAAIVRALQDSPGVTGAVLLGDLAPGYEVTGPIEQTAARMGETELFICSETIEHLDDPDTVLGGLRCHARLLVLSTPLGETAPDNPEHYWGWDHDGVRDMLAGAGWEPVIQRDVLHPLAAYQIWGCR